MLYQQRDGQAGNIRMGKKVMREKNPADTWVSWDEEEERGRKWRMKRADEERGRNEMLFEEDERLV